MLAQALFLVASAAIASAQITFNGSNIICPANNPNSNFCAGASLTTNIIIHCVNGVAQPGNCNDNLDGEPPVGLNPTLCYQSSLTAGDATCSKNCIAYGATESTLPNCQPYYTASSSSTASSTSTSSSPTYSPTYPTTTTSTGTTVVTTGFTTLTQTFTTTYCPTSSPYATGTGSSPPPPNNGTLPTTSAGSGGNPTNTPSGPSSTASGFTGAAAATLSPVGMLAGVGLVAAYFL